MSVALQIKPRDAKASSETLRKAGAVPAVFYGPKEGATPVAIDARALEHVIKSAGQTSVITLRGVGDEKETLLRDVQVHPVSGKVLHVDFYVIEKGKKVKVAIPLEFEGESPAEKLGNVLAKSVHEVEIEVAPADLPHTLKVDLTTLVNVGDHITAADIPLPKSAALTGNPEEIIVSVTKFEEYKENVVPTEAAPLISETEKAGEGAAAEGEGGMEAAAE